MDSVTPAPTDKARETPKAMTVDRAIKALLDAMVMNGCKRIDLVVNGSGEPMFRVQMAGKPGRGMDVRDFYDVDILDRGADAESE